MRKFINLNGSLLDFANDGAREDRGADVLRYPRVMGTNVHIEVDEQTAGVLQTRAAELGMTVSELVAELAVLETEPVSVDEDAIAELDRRWQKVQDVEHAVSHERVVRWLRTWGTSRFRPWQDE